MTRFASFWSGPLSPYEACCLASFAEKGHEVRLYSYEAIAGLPPGVWLCDASAIVEESCRTRFITGGRPNIAHFADYFRYRLFLREDVTWIDTDVYLLEDFVLDSARNFFVIEDDTNICNAILHIRRDEPALPRIIERTAAFMDRDMPWAATQNVIAKSVDAAELARSAHRPADYMPVHYDAFYQFLLPEYRESCAALCRTAKTIHLFNNILDRLGLYKGLLPPAGSYLHDLFAGKTAAAGFVGTYPATVVRRIVDNWRLYNSGETLGVKAVARQLFPSLNRSIRRLLTA